MAKADREAKKQGTGKEKVQECLEPVGESSPPSKEAPVVEDDGDKLSSEEEALKLTSRGWALKKPSRFVC